MKRFAVGVALIAGVFLLLRGTPAQAHHSFATLYLEKDMIEVEGDVVEFQYRNPHTFVLVQGEEKGGVGGQKIFAAEWVSVSQLDRMEIDKTFFKIGDHVRIWASPNKNPNDNRIHLKRIERKDGWKWAGGRGDTR